MRKLVHRLRTADFCIIGQSPLNDISIALDNTKVVGFVKKYGKLINTAVLRRYVILKRYTMTIWKHLLRTKHGNNYHDSFKASVVIADETVFLSLDSNKPDDSVHAWFFTSMTKKILIKCNQELVCKRSSNFGTITIEDLGNVASELPDSDSASIVETPKQKNRGEEKNVQPA